MKGFIEVTVREFGHNSAGEPFTVNVDHIVKIIHEDSFSLLMISSDKGPTRIMESYAQVLGLVDKSR